MYIYVDRILFVTFLASICSSTVGQMYVCAQKLKAKVSEPCPLSGRELVTEVHARDKRGGA